MSDQPKYVQDFYPDELTYCYGCGRNNPLGLSFRTRWDGNRTRTEYRPRAEHMGVPGFVYGGLIASLIDCHSTGSATLAYYRHQGHELGDAAPVPRFVTASLKIDFLKPTPISETLVVYGEIVSIGARKVIVHSSMYAGELLTARGEAVLVLIPPTMMTPKPASTPSEAANPSE
ncbi:PaaI family thioesterase [Desulfothermobacter acidiphilus]|uniref:PaaI family thioesterase n=1 Tax=Desulfothermobacter acidiphilus TaxID=1938353 RepID=UPI003F898646